MGKKNQTTTTTVTPIADPFRDASLQNIGQLLGLPNTNYASYGLDKLDNQTLWNMMTNLDQRRSDSTVKADTSWLTNSNLGSAISPYVNAAFNPNIKVSSTGTPQYQNPDGSVWNGAPSNAGGTMVTPATTTTNTNTNKTNNSGYLTLDDLNDWWTTAQADMSSLYSNNNNKNNNTGNNSGNGGALDYTQGLATLYPRVDWGNYQTNNRGSRYFNSNTGTYGNNNNMGGNISL